MIKALRWLLEAVRIRPPITPTMPRVVYKYLSPERIDVLEAACCALRRQSRLTIRSKPGPSSPDS